MNRTQLKGSCVISGSSEGGWRGRRFEDLVKRFHGDSSSPPPLPAPQTSAAVRVRFFGLHPIARLAASRRPSREKAPFRSVGGIASLLRWRGLSGSEKS